TCSRALGVPLAFAREICVPVRAFRELPSDELRALLAHEAAHVVRRDAAWLVIAAAVRTLGWWQPLNLFAAARLRLAMELCCDERAVAGPRQRAALARCLVRVAEWSVQDHGPALAAMVSRTSALRRRLDALLDDAPRRARRPPGWCRRRAPLKRQPRSRSTGAPPLGRRAGPIRREHRLRASSRSPHRPRRNPARRFRFSRHPGS